MWKIQKIRKEGSGIMRDNELMVKTEALLA